LGSLQHVSAITRKRLAAKVLERLDRGGAVVSQLKEDFSKLTTAHTSQEEALELSAAEHRNTQTFYQESQEQHAQAMDRLDEITAQLHAQQEHCASLADQCHQEEAVRHALDNQVRKLNQDVIVLVDRAKAAEAAQDAMREEHEEAMRTMREATEQGLEASSKLRDAESRALKAQSTSHRAQQVQNLSRLTCCQPAMSMPAPVANRAALMCIVI
jgi:chromosome segregation ATPase